VGSEMCIRDSLQEWLEKRPLKAGEHAIAAAFGPGFSAEFLLLQWN